MSRWVSTLGKSTLAVAICDRCRMKRPRADLVNDPNTPGILACADCVDLFDPYRLAARGPENIVVDGVRLDASVVPGFDALPERLTISGPDLIDRNGNVVLLRGFSWGRFGAVRPQDGTDNIAQGANCVRIPLRWWGFYVDDGVNSRDDTQPNLLNPRNLAILDFMIQTAVDAGLWIVLFLDSDCGQNGDQNVDDAAYCDPEGKYPNGHNFWTDLAERKKFIQLWQFIADRYLNTPRIAMFECMPEPNPTNFTNTDIANFYRDVIAGIREIDTRTLFMIGADAYNPRHLAQVALAERTDVVYTGNLFMFTGDTHANNISNWQNRLQGLIDFRTGANAPVFCDQVGVVSNVDADLSYETAMLSGLTNADIGYARWEYRDNTQPDQYGLLYIDANGNEVTKTTRLALISSYFNQP